MCNANRCSSRLACDIRPRTSHTVDAKSLAAQNWSIGCPAEHVPIGRVLWPKHLIVTVVEPPRTGVGTFCRKLHKFEPAPSSSMDFSRCHYFALLPNFRRMNIDPAISVSKHDENLLSCAALPIRYALRIFWIWRREPCHSSCP